MRISTEMYLALEISVSLHSALRQWQQGKFTLWGRHQNKSLACASNTHPYHGHRKTVL